MLMERSYTRWKDLNLPLKEAEKFFTVTNSSELIIFLGINLITFLVGKFFLTLLPGFPFHENSQMTHVWPHSKAAFYLLFSATRLLFSAKRGEKLLLSAAKHDVVLGIMDK